MSNKYTEVSDVKEHVGKLILQKIEANGWYQRQAASVIGVSQPRLSALYNGKYSHFSLDKLLEIAKKVNVNVEIIVTNEIIVNTKESDNA